MALVAPGVVRFAINGTFAGTRPWTNIWDVDMLAPIGESRELACLAYANEIVPVWDGSIAQSISEQVVMTDITWVDLDSETGSTGAISTTGGAGTEGDQTGPVLPANVAVLATKQAASARGSRNGRMYIPGLPESDADGLDISAGALATLNDRLDAFLTALTDPASVQPVAAQPVVLHTRNIGTPSNPNIVYAGHDPILTLVAQSRLATQRRRLRS